MIPFHFSACRFTMGMRTLACYIRWTNFSLRRVNSERVRLGLCARLSGRCQMVSVTVAVKSLKGR